LFAAAAAAAAAIIFLAVQIANNAGTIACHFLLSALL